MKVAKAKKSTHKKGKAQKQIRGKVLRTTKHDPNAEYEIAVSTLSQKLKKYYTTRGCSIECMETVLNFVI